MKNDRFQIVASLTATTSAIMDDVDTRIEK